MRFANTVISAAVGVSMAASSLVLAADAEGLPGKQTRKPEAAQQCLSDIKEFDAKLVRIGFGIVPPRGYGTPTLPSYNSWGAEGTPRQKIRSMRDTALTLALDGDEKTCQAVFASMRQIFDKHQTLVGTEIDDPLARVAWRRAHLSRAKPVAKMNHLVRANIVIGSQIRNLKDEKLGEIEDLVLNPKEPDILYVLVSRGGILGFGEKLAAIRWNDLRATADHELYLLDVSAQALTEAPKVDRRNFENTANAEWREKFAAYWDGVLKPKG